MHHNFEFMCLHPISIPNPSKYVSLKYSDRFLLQVRCENCAECQNQLKNEWFYRAWYEFEELSTCGGYALFDTLTYRDDKLPHLSDTWTLLPKSADFPCFNYLHIRNFLQALYQRIARKGYDKHSVRYFIAGEYGTHEKYTHRPHYHIVLYVANPKIDPLWLSRQISELWNYGRTDGAPWKSIKYVLSHNVLSASTSSQGSRLRTCSYVTKYIQKSCKFQRELDKRVYIALQECAKYVNPDNPDKWLDSPECQRYRQKLIRTVNQFHRQSQGFGSAALRDMDMNELFETGSLRMPSTSQVVTRIPLPSYYRRKLFYELVEFNGSRYWQETFYGRQYREFRKKKTMEYLSNRFSSVINQYNLPFHTSSELAGYVLNKRGRIISDNPDDSNLEMRCNDIEFFNYSTLSDKIHFRVRGLTRQWCGDTQQGYTSPTLPHRITLSNFINNHVYLNENYEKQLNIIYQHLQPYNTERQKAFELRQHLDNVFKPLILKCC